MLRDYNLLTKLQLLAGDVTDVSDDTIQDFAQSELPNEFFLTQFINVNEEPFCYKKYWNSFAKILINRGVDKISDVKTTMLIWLQDVNWPGSDLIWDFVLSNVSAFRDALKECILTSITTRDEAWFNALLALVFKSQDLSDVEISKKLKEAEFLLQDKDTIENLSVKLDEIIN